MKKVFFVGIAGIGMSALARYFISLGYYVFGSDIDTESMQQLKNEGINIFSSHSDNNISSDFEFLVFSEAIPENNPERVFARKNNIKEFSYFQMLGEVSRNLYTIAIAGTHGKSTTTAMTGLALEKCKLDPFVILGTKVFEWQNKNIRIPKIIKNNNIFVVEACEYKDSFLNLEPSVLIITNIEPDHLDYFKNEDAYYLAFEKLVNNVKENGYIIADFDNKIVKKITKNFKGKKINRNAVEQLKLKVIGDHNIENAQNVICLSGIFDLKINCIKNSLLNFNGTWRRLEYKGRKYGLDFFSDYAHHPTEIKKTISAFRKHYGDKKIIVVFQPHQHSRTKILLKEFSNSFSDADLVLIPNIFSVRDDKKFISSNNVNLLVKEINIISDNAVNSHNFKNTLKNIEEENHNDGIVILMGAGDVYKIFDM